VGAGDRERGECGGGSNPGGGMDEENSPGGYEDVYLEGSDGMACLGGGTMEAAIFELIDLRYCCLKERRFWSDSG
jgi:hypothetical protein